MPGATVGGRAVELDARHLREPAERVGGELVLVRLDRLQADRLEVVDRRAEADRLRHRRRSRLELVRQLAPRRLLEAHRADHVPAGEERLHLCSSSVLPQSAPTPLGPHILWPEIARKSTPSACTSSFMCGAACAASQTKIAPCSCAHGASLCERVDRPERVRDEARRDDLDVPFARDRVEAGEVELAVLVERDQTQLGAGLPGDVLPRARSSSGARAR